MKFRVILLALCAFGLPYSLRAQNPVPLISPPLTPASVVPGSGSFTLTVHGTGFVKGTVVKWNGSTRTTTVVSESVLMAQINANDVSVAGTAIVRAVNPAPGGGASNAAFLSVTNPISNVGWLGKSNWRADGVQILAVDVNQDRKLDVLLASTYRNSLTVLLGNGDGTLQPAASYPAGRLPTAAITGDFNKDGSLDIALINPFDDAVSVLMNHGDGSFAAPVSYGVGSGAGPAGLVAGDFNRDGILDVAVSLLSQQGIFMLLGNGDGTFHNGSVSPAADLPDQLGAGDFNGDGKLDILVVNFNPFISVMLGNGDGTFQAAQQFTATGYAPPEIADLNGDGKLDVLLAAGTGGIATLLGNGDGTLGPVKYYSFQRKPPGWLALADFNGDGKLDVAAVGGGNKVTVLHGNGDGSFRPPFYDFATGPSSFGVAAGDFNGDGKMDLVSSSNVTPANISVLLQSAAVFSVTAVSFGGVKVGTSKSSTVTLTNAAASALTISSVSIIGENPGVFSQTNDCGSSVPAGASCTFTVVFAPTFAGPREALLSVSDGSSSSPQRLALSGSGN